MARIYSRRKGKARSKKPIRKTKLTWLRYNPKEIELLVVKLAKSGNNQSQIGLILRDVYGIPDVKSILKKKISTILEENNIKSELPLDIVNLIKREILIMKHLENNKKDMPAKRGLIITESKIKRLVKYYKRVGKLPENWVYDREQAKLLIS